MMEYRRLTPADAALASTINAFREGLIDGGAVEKFLADDRSVLFCAVDGERVAAFAYGYRLPRTDGGRDMLYIHEVCVADELRGQGVGTALMTALRGFARYTGIGKMFLITSADNTAANALYRKVGGRVSEGSAAGDVCYYFKLA